MENKYGRVNVDKKQAEEKKKMPVYVKYGIAAVILLAVIVSATLIWYNAAGSYVATVGDMKIGVKEYRYYLETQKDYMLRLAQSADPNVNPATFWDSDIGGQKAIDIAKKSALEGIRDVKILLAKAKEAKVTLTSEEKKSIDTGIKNNYIDPPQLGNGNRIKANKMFMDELGFGIDDIKKVQEENYLVQKYQEKVITERNISEDEQKKEFDKDPKKFDEVTVTHVLFLYDGPDGKRSKEDSKKLADETLAKVKAGENIGEIAKKSSEDPGVAQNNGVYTFAKEGQYVPEFEEWAFSANAGDSGIVETSYGYHVMKLDKRDSKDFADVKEQIKNQLSYNMYNEELKVLREDSKNQLKTNDVVYNEIV